MRRLLLVDDEAWIRRGLREQLDWEALGMTIVGEAGDGVEALEALDTLNPDIAICDIRMPELDGLEFACKARDRGSSCAIILYSGYQDFEYARQAIRLGVVDYLLKPIDGAALERAVRAALGRSETAKESRGVRPSRRPRIDPCECFVLCLVRSPSLNDVDADLARSLRTSARAFASLREGLSIDAWLERGEANALCFALHSGQCTAMALSNDGLKLAQTLVSCSPEERVVFLGVSAAHGGSEPLTEALREAEDAVDEAIGERMKGGEGIAVYARLEKPAFRADASEASEFEALFRAGNEAGCKEWIQRQFEATRSGEQKVRVLRNNLSLVFLTLQECLGEQGNESCDSIGPIRKALVAIDEELDIGRLETLALAWLESASTVLYPDRRTGSEELAYRAKAYIEKHYNEKIGLAEVASTLGYHQVYLSKSFKRHLGINLNEYLNELRLLRARELIEEGYSVDAIAEMVGYGSPGYFSLRFKDRFDVSPARYKAINDAKAKK